VYFVPSLFFYVAHGYSKLILLQKRIRRRMSLQLMVTSLLWMQVQAHPRQKWLTMLQQNVQAVRLNTRRERLQRNRAKVTSPNFLSMLPVAMARSSSDGVAIHYGLPVSRMTSCFHTMDQWVNEHGVVWFAVCQCWWHGRWPDAGHFSPPGSAGRLAGQPGDVNRAGDNAG